MTRPAARPSLDHSGGEGRVVLELLCLYPEASGIVRFLDTNGEGPPPATETRAKLAENLEKARAVRAAKRKPTKATAKTSSRVAKGNKANRARKTR